MHCSRWVKRRVFLILPLLFGASLLFEWRKFHFEWRNSSNQTVKDNKNKIKDTIGRPLCGDGILQDYRCLDEYDFRDRAFAEKRLVPPAVVNELQKTAGIQKRKRIVVIDHRHAEPVGRDINALRGRLTPEIFDYSQESLESADAVLYRDQFLNGPKFTRPKGQIWVLVLRESPHLSPDLTSFKDKFNYTATYRTSSSIYAPYGIYRRYKNRRVPKGKQINYAEGRLKKAAWFVSNCDRNLVSSDRIEYVKELNKHIRVDIYGRCGDTKFNCSGMEECLKPYKFYLAFENANCRDYITEKLFHNSYRYNILPIVKGAHPDDYKKVAPPNSYIHVDDFDSPKDLAKYLDKLDKDDELYNQYFKWHELGYVDYEPYFDVYCRICTMMWSNRPPTWNVDVDAWWRRDGICIGKGKSMKWTPNITNVNINDQHIYQHILN